MSFEIFRQMKIYSEHPAKLHIDINQLSIDSSQAWQAAYCVYISMTRIYQLINGQFHAQFSAELNGYIFQNIIVLTKGNIYLGPRLFIFPIFQETTTEHFF